MLMRSEHPSEAPGAGSASVAHLRQRLPEMVDALAELVSAESPSSDPEACAACTAVADDLALRILRRRTEQVVSNGRTHLRWSFGERARVLLVGHLDTVWPAGTLARWPFAVDDDRASGPGVFDMKAGVVQMLFALGLVAEQLPLDGVTVLLTTDEELGSPTSRALLCSEARDVRAALVLEPSAHGALKTERKGVAHFRVDVSGRAAHAGLHPERGVNAALEVAECVTELAALARPSVGTTVTPSVLSAGTAANTVPAAATARFDVRFTTLDEAERVTAGFTALAPHVAGATLAVEREVFVPPLERKASHELFQRAQGLAPALGLAALEEVSVGGGSDGNTIAALGVPTLDGLGAVGDHAHAEGEFVVVSAMAERAALVAALVADLLSE
jgi:glutamate carboxypeptidase